MILTIRPATLDEANWISTRLRPEDAREVEAATGSTAQVVLPRAFSLPHESYTIRSGDEVDPCVIFGVTADPNETDRGVVWMLATPAVKTCALALLREAPHWLDHFEQKYPKGIHNYIDLRNTLHVRWCQRAGFSFGDVYIVKGVSFVHAYRQRQACAAL